MTEHWLIHLAAIAGLCLASVAASRLLRAAGAGVGAGAGSGAAAHAALGGVLAGLLLGPTVLGRIAPDMFERLFVGGAAEQVELNALLSVASEASLQPDFPRPSAEQLDQAQRRLNDARWEHQTLWRWSTLGLAAVLLLAHAPAPGSSGGTKRSTPLDRDGHPRAHIRGRDGQPLRGPIRRQDGGWLAAISVGLWAAALPGGLIYIVMRTLFDQPLGVSVAIASALAIGPAAMNEDDRRAADQAEIGGALLLQRASRISTVLAIAALLGVLLFDDTRTPFWVAAPLLAIPVMWIIGARMSGLHRIAPALLSMVAAMSMMHIDVITEFGFWPLVVIVLLSGDGRLLGAYLGAILPGGRSGWRTMRLVIGSMGAGVSQLALLAIITCTWIAPGEYSLALLAGVVLVEMSASARRSLVEHILEVEQSEHEQ